MVKDGPSLEQYIETRFNLLTTAVDKMEAGLLVRIEHLHQLANQTQEASKRAIDKAEAAQAAHNIASNEWRGTLNDFKSTLVSKAEFDRFYQEFSAYRLETSRTSSLFQGEKSGVKESKDSNLAVIGLIVAIVSTLVSLLIGRLT